VDPALPFTDAERRALDALEDSPSLNALVARFTALEHGTPGDVYRAVFIGLSCGALRSPSRFGASPVAARDPHEGARRA
jgi:hypothetical protein